MENEHNGGNGRSGGRDGDGPGFGEEGETSVSVPRSFLVGQFARTGKALCELGVTYLRIGIAFALGADVAQRDEALEKTAETIHILNGTYRAIRRATIEKETRP